MIPLMALILLQCVNIAATTGRVFWLATFIAAGRPVYGTLTLGQGSIFIVLGVIMALHYARSRPRIAGIGLALASMKPTFGIPLGLLMLCRRDIRAFKVGFLVGGVAALIPALILVISAGGLAEVMDGMRNGLRQYNQLTDNALEQTGWMRINASILLVRLLGVPAVPILGVIVAFVGLGAAGLAIYLKPEPPVEIGGHSLSSAIISLATLVAVHHLIYDAILVLLPLVVLLISSKHPWNTLTARLRFSLAGLLICLWLNYLPTNLGLRITGLNAGTTGWSIVTSINSAVLLVTFGACLSLTFSARARQEPQEDP
jgi:hypothetical protein